MKTNYQIISYLRQNPMSSSQFSQSITLSELIDESGMVIDHKDKEIIITIPKIK